ncbi:MAG: N-6 DNA methylase, partial [Negativicutes bacterium]|nr:N-6 DNA methylase [Negativicutes bacterium]
MNWPKLMAEYRLVAAWLSSAGSGDAGHDALRIIAAVLRGCQTPEAAVQAALQRTCGDMPDAVHGIIGRWQLCLPRDPLLLGEFYERTAYGRKALGLYYTPPEAVNFILRHTVANCDIVANPGLKILDPACGCGYFLLAAYELLWQKYRANRDALAALYPDEDWSDDGIHRRIVCENLWGADIDPVAAEIAALGLFLKRPQASACLRPHIVICDSLRRISDLEAEAEDKAFWRNHYDFVIGNPPYLSF